ncbi:protein GLUTAMINE DUMPER 5-like [Amaranthus tricolor]|uniref:protein GLUTAMINE DUMPER 5-like n=1 Tax=Amaranthus tricolor TaxID=29722 RepID=UPI00258C5F6A|nr:protein GLUTAMINE DUMPER 5-like [Amaranthus tricolor]
MRQLGISLNLEATFEAQHHPPQHHQITPPPAGWKSPVPYLFGGLAAMLGLIAFALLILACSYWKLSGVHDSGAGEDSGEVTGDEKPTEASTATAYLNGIFVIMAGEMKPTFLATPATSRASSFENCSSSSSNKGEDKEEKDVEVETTTFGGGDEEKR